MSTGNQWCNLCQSGTCEHSHEFRILRDMRDELEAKVKRLETYIYSLQLANQRPGCNCPQVHGSACQLGPNAMAQRASLRNPYR